MRDKVTLLLLGLVAAALVGLCLVAQEKGAVTLTAPGATLQFDSRLGGGVVVHSESGPTTLSPGTYRPASLMLTAERDGEDWRALSSGPWGKLGRIQVAPGRTTTIELGPPLRIQPEVAVSGGQVWVALGLFGRAGEKYSNAILRNDQRIREPKVSIIDEAGTVLTSGRFQFG